MIKISEETWRWMRSNYLGYCPDCHDYELGEFEPDAEDRACDMCDGTRAMGAETALMVGEIIIHDDCPYMPSKCLCDEEEK